MMPCVHAKLILSLIVKKHHNQPLISIENFIASGNVEIPASKLESVPAQHEDIPL